MTDTHEAHHEGMAEATPPHATIKVIGAGGGGCNAVDSMVNLGVPGVETIVLNTDSRALEGAACEKRIQMGAELTQGLGSGGDPEIGRQAAEDAAEDIRRALEGADMVFITAGLGGGTGTGAAPVIARIAKEIGALTVAILTKPFRFEGPQRMKRAIQGIESLREHVDTMIIISNDRLLEVSGPDDTLVDAFAKAHNVLCQGVESISELISEPGLINVDFADVRAIMGGTQGAVMGIGSASGENRAIEAVNQACSSSLLDKIVIDGARGVLISIAGGDSLKLHEVSQAMTHVYDKADPNANIIFGAVTNPKLGDEVRVTIIATGFFDEEPTGEATARAEAMARRKDPNQPLESPVSPVSLKSKLESMMGGGVETGLSQALGNMPPASKPNGNGDGHANGGGGGANGNGHTNGSGKSSVAVVEAKSAENGVLQPKEAVRIDVDIQNESRNNLTVEDKSSRESDGPKLKPGPRLHPSGGQFSALFNGSDVAIPNRDSDRPASPSDLGVARAQPEPVEFKRPKPHKSTERIPNNDSEERTESDAGSSADSLSDSSSNLELPAYLRNPNLVE